MVDQTAKRIRSFHGPLNADTLPVVAEALKTLLERGPYIHIAAYEYLGWRPEVEVGCVVEKVEVTDGEYTTGIMIVDNSHVRGLYINEVSDLLISEREIRYRFRTPEGRGCWIVIVPSQDGGEKQ